jgi:prolipoprotein diacylglyceryltransferase
MVALGFLAAAWVLSLELKRKEKLGLLLPTEESITIGEPASISELFFNAISGFVFGYKLVGLFFFKPDALNAQEYIFSKEGSILGGLVLAFVLGWLKWSEKNKQKLKIPENRLIRIWPHDRVGDIIILGLVFGILGAKLFDNFEHWDEFIAHPIQSLFSQSGLTFYGGLILATAAIYIFSFKKGISFKHLCDAAAPALMIAYAVGRLGCQISGDGDWGIYNSAYKSDNKGNITLAQPGDFQNALQKDSTYFLEGKVTDGMTINYVTDRTYSSLASVPHRSFKGPSFLPKWLFAYSYPQNVNKDGVRMAEISDEHNRVLPAPVFPTPLYETIACTLLFLLMWVRRNKIKAPLLMFGIYLMLNGAERLIVECIRVNRPYSIFGIQSTQAQFIAVVLIIIGLLISIFSKYISSKKKIAENLN